jgi:hypothetical protein
LKKNFKSDIIRDVFAIHIMSRTYRSAEGWHSGALRFPHTFNEIRQLDGILHEEDLEGLPVSGLNHLKAREHNLPTAWDDKVISAYYETN